MLGGGEALQFIDHLEARLGAEMIHAANVDEVVETERILAMAREVVELLAGDDERELAAKFFLADHRELCGEGGSGVARGSWDFERFGHGSGNIGPQPPGCGCI
jgi:hypothetical protein